jgi:nitric oxide reductase subunit C
MADNATPVKQRVLLTLLVGFAFFTSFIYTTWTDVEPVSISQKGKEGKLLYQKYNCTACHQFYGLGGYIGPDLTNAMTTTGKGEPYVRAFLKVGTDVMPNYNLTDSEIDALVAFLAYVGTTGNFPERNVRRTWYGSIKIPKPSR